MSDEPPDAHDERMDKLRSDCRRLPTGELIHCDDIEDQDEEPREYTR